MPEFRIHGRPASSVFGLHRDKENDATLALGWTLSKSTTFLSLLLKKLGLDDSQLDKASVRLQQYGTGSTEGITDIEIEVPGEFFLIVEAKIGWVLPSEAQIEKYWRRERFKKFGNAGNSRSSAVGQDCTSGRLLTGL